MQSPAALARRANDGRAVSLLQIVVAIKCMAERLEGRGCSTGDARSLSIFSARSSNRLTGAFFMHCLQKVRGRVRCWRSSSSIFVGHPASSTWKSRWQQWLRDTSRITPGRTAWVVQWWPSQIKRSIIPSFEESSMIAMT